MLFFLTKRLIRVVPAYWLVTVIYYFLYVKYPDTQLVLNSLLFIPPEHIDQAVIKDPPFFAYPALNVGWTLNYEMWFYLVFAISLLFGKWRMAAIVCFLTVPMLFSWAYTQSFLFHPHQGVRYDITYLSLISNPILLEFLAGIFLGAIYKSPKFTPSKQNADCALILALSIFLYSWIAGYFHGSGKGFIFHSFLSKFISREHGLLKSGLFCFVFFFLFLIRDKYKILPIAPFFTKLADASYMIYLVHVPVFHLIMQKLHFLSKNPFLLLFIYFILSIVVALLAHILIEKPMTQLLRHIFLPRKKKTTSTVKRQKSADNAS